jgi:hypothetical protein
MNDQPKPASVDELFVCNKCGYAGGNSQHEGCNYFAAPAKPASVAEIVSVLRRWGNMEEIKDVPESLRRMAFADMRALADWIETQMKIQPRQPASVDEIVEREKWTRTSAICLNCRVIQHDQIDGICTTCNRLELRPISKRVAEIAFERIHNELFQSPSYRENCIAHITRACEEATEGARDENTAHQLRIAELEGYLQAATENNDRLRAEIQQLRQQLEQAKGYLSNSKSFGSKEKPAGN